MAAHSMIAAERDALRASQSPIGPHRRHSHHQQQQQQMSSSSTTVLTIGGEAPKMLSRHNTACRNFFGKIEGSLRKFGACPDRAKTILTNPWSIKYRPHGTEVGAERCGDPSRTYILSAKLVWVSNPFPVSVFLSSDSFRGNCYGEEKQRGFFVAPPAYTVSYNTPKPIVLASPQLLSTIVDVYGRCDESSGSTGVSQMDDDTYLIRPGTPLCKVLEDGQQNDQEPYNLREMRIEIGTGEYRYRVSKRLYNSAQHHFRNKIIPRLPHIDASQICVYASRANAAWDASLGMFSGASGESCDSAIMDVHGSIEFLLEMEYRLIA